MQSTTQNKAKNILIIEDEGDMCLLLNIMLLNENINLDHVKSLKAAKEYLQNEKPDLVMLDNKLPDGMGIDFINHIKQNHPTVKIVMISGYAASAKDVALENGADLFLEKPFTKKQVYQSVQQLLN